MVSATDPRQDQLDNEIAMPSWLFWLQLGLTTTLAVLFVVMLVKTRQQSVNIRDLQDKVAGLENRSALDRTTAIEDQLRSTSERLQSLERLGAQMAGLSADNARLRQELRGLEGSLSKPAAGLPPDDTIAPLPPIKP
ncbi:MAG: hypothetical protein VKM92_07640 [Cyanobacteriota bacterium]|nr:hypothetical protein [Cyanobacteriota bacterium]